MWWAATLKLPEIYPFLVGLFILEHTNVARKDKDPTCTQLGVSFSHDAFGALTDKVPSSVAAYAFSDGDLSTP